MTDDTAPLQNATGAWIEGWCATSANALLSLWDNTDEKAIYRAAERVEPFIGGNAVTHYVQSVCTMFKPIQHRVEDPTYRRLSEDIGSVFYTLNWMFTDKNGPMGGTCRVTALWRKVDEDWRIFHYAEAPLAPLLELQAFYEEVAADGLDAIPSRGLQE